MGHGLGDLHAGMMKPRILVVADDAALRAALARWLMAAGYAVEPAETPKHARDVIADAGIALAILALDRLGPAGLELAREVGAQIEHVIVIAGQPNAAGSPTGSSISSGDYLAMPVSEHDLLARVKAALGATPTDDESADRQFLHFEGFVLDTGGRSCVPASGQEVTLTRAEFSLMLTLAKQPGRVLSRDELSYAVAGRAAGPEDRSVDVLISRLRRKIEPDPKSPRIIVTVPSGGYKFTAKPQAARPSAVANTDSQVAPAEDRPTTPHQTATQVIAIQDAKAVASFSGRHRSIAAWTVGALVSLAGLLVIFWYPGFATKGVPGSAPRAQQFDAAVIPLVNSSVRRELASYVARPDVKAVAISAAPGSGWGVAFGAPDAEAAKREALDRCSAKSAPRVCRIYAVGSDVVWSPASLPVPLPADIHAEPLDVSLAVTEIPALTDASRREISEKYLPLRGHKALAVGRQGVLWNGSDEQAEAVRLAIERCGDSYQAPCLLLSVDGFLTIRIPKSRPIESIFMLSLEPEMSEADRQRIAPIYAGKDWRALARGRSGHWYAVGGRETEGDAIDGALKSCRAAEPECILHAIGNWRVGEKRDSDRR
jgi:two-component system OmpR family response regulator